ncbi:MULTISPECIES: LysR family transcriptional regulator [unclassified Paenibacillus]|uniref:LysR family transcriptional regulator n=1 Tax=unclassified Paenibacillus TaxID=185978 RepID=UPI001043E654|nr:MULTISPECIES: LysR family transcriptional regulator [unclassified Paenibacillus]NIK69932.1 DNA-binding transcriptional LysR family regulator [Paenibacillus sp. BK720]TCM97766.1 DNA-binding transcriptional LysR family regulator [Paenibacillus sp. BK033]
MELTQLEYFLKVARMEHLTRAAESLSITQPALSHSILKLETELGVPLFERKGRNLKINRYGMMFSKHVEKILQQVERGKKEIEEHSNPESGVIHLAYLNILGVDLIPKLIREYQLANPAITFELSQGDKGTILNQVEEGHSDLMITSEKPVNETYEWVPLLSLPLYLVVSEEHRLANEASVQLGEIAGEPFVGLKHNCSLRNSLLARVHHQNFTLASTYDAEDLQTVAGFVAAGLGISVLPQTAGLNLNGIKWIPIAEEGWRWEVGLHLKKERFLSPATARFVGFIKEKAGF